MTVRRYSTTGALQTFVVPAGVTSIFCELWGGASPYRDSSGAVQWVPGGKVSGNLPVTPGQTLNLHVPQDGTLPGDGSILGRGSSPGPYLNGGVGGDAAGGAGAAYGGDGAGAADIRIGGNTNDLRKAVAAGAGGAGARYPASSGPQAPGGVGGPTGGNGADGGAAGGQGASTHVGAGGSYGSSRAVPGW